MEVARQKLYEAGAHFVIDTVNDLPGVVDEINDRIREANFFWSNLSGSQVASWEVSEELVFVLRRLMRYAVSQQKPFADEEQVCVRNLFKKVNKGQSFL